MWTFEGLWGPVRDFPGTFPDCSFPPVRRSVRQSLVRSEWRVDGGVIVGRESRAGPAEGVIVVDSHRLGR